MKEILIKSRSRPGISNVKWTSDENKMRWISILHVLSRRRRNRYVPSLNYRYYNGYVQPQERMYGERVYFHVDGFGTRLWENRISIVCMLSSGSYQRIWFSWDYNTNMRCVTPKHFCRCLILSQIPMFAKRSWKWWSDCHWRWSVHIQSGFSRLFGYFLNGEGGDRLQWTDAL